MYDLAASDDVSFKGKCQAVIVSACVSVIINNNIIQLQQNASRWTDDENIFVLVNIIFIEKQVAGDGFFFLYYRN